MGQEICAIITDKKANYQQSLVHFYEDNVVIIPFEVGCYEMEYFFKKAVNFSKLEDWLDYLKHDKDVEIEPEFKHSVFTIIEVIETYGITNFALHYYSEFSDIPDKECYIAVLDGLIIGDSIYFSTDRYSSGDGEKFDSNYNSVDKYNGIIGLNRTWYANEERYFWYRASEKDYLKNL